MQNWQFRPANDLGLPLRQQLRSVRRENGLFNVLTHFAWGAASAVYLKIAHRLAIDGRQHLPKSGSFVMVANHASHLDTIVLASAMKWRMQSRVFPVAAGDTFFSTTLAGTFSALLINALPMWRNRTSSHGLADLRDRLTQESCVYIVFPEGTRTRTGSMSSFKPGIGMLVAGTNVPIVPCRLIGTFQALPFNRRLPKPTKLRLTIGQPLLFDQISNDRPGWDTVAASTESAVAALSETTCSGRMPATQ